MKIMYFLNTDWYANLHWLDRFLAAKEEGFDVSIICTFTNKETKVFFEEKGFHCYDLKLDRFSTNAVSNIVYIYKFLKLYWHIKPNLLHLITIKSIIIGGISTLFTGSSAVISFVGLGRVFHDDKSWRSRILKKIIILLYKLILIRKCKTSLIFEHRSDKDELNKYIKLEKNDINIIEGAGIDTDLFEYTAEVNNRKFIILFASRLLKSKGLELLVHAVDDLRKEGYKDIELQVAGIIDETDPDRIEINDIKNWSQGNKIKWLGTRSDIADLIKKSNLVILPTQYPEGVPRIIIEACSIGRACIVSNNPGCMSIIKDDFNGCIITNNQKDEIIEKIKYLYHDDFKRSEFGMRSRKIVEQRFCKKIVLSKTIGLYKKILNNDGNKKCQS